MSEVVDLLVSVHMPKTAGTSFRKSLEDHFEDSLLQDYNDIPINTPAYERNQHALQACIEIAEQDFRGVNCIHGHFLPLKYLLLGMKREIKFITWLRDPVERLASHYWFWKKTFNPQTSLPLHKQVVEENWSLEHFCLGPELKNFYWQFFWGFALERFDFIGIAEHYDDDLAYFAKTFLGVELPAYKANIGDKRTGGTPYITDPDFRQAIEKHHSIDIELYQRAVTLRAKTRGDEK